MNCPVCGLPTWCKDLKTNRQMDNLIKLVQSMKDLVSADSLPDSRQPIGDPVSFKIVRETNHVDSCLEKTVIVRKRASTTNITLPTKKLCVISLNDHITKRPGSKKGLLSHCFSVGQSPLLTAQKSYSTCANVSNNIQNTSLYRPIVSTFGKPSRQRKYSTVEANSSVSCQENCEFPFSPLVTKTRNYSKLDKAAKLQRLQQIMGKDAIKGKRAKQLTLHNFVVRSKAKRTDGM